MDNAHDASQIASMDQPVAAGAVVTGIALHVGNFPDPKEVKDNSAMVNSAVGFLKNWDKILNSLVVNPERAMEELNSDWTASQELADVLMRKHK